MLRTIAIGSCVLVQGDFVRELEDGRIMVKVDNKVFVGAAIPMCKANGNAAAA